MAFFTFAAAGAALILIGAFEAIASSSTLASPPPQSNPPKKMTHSKSSFLYFLLASLLSLLFILNSLLSFFDAVNSHDRVGSAQQLQVVAIAALFLLYGATGLLVNFTGYSSSFPPPLLNLIALFGFVEEFMYFYLQRKDTIGIENRYFDLLLVPIFICLFSTLLEIHDNSVSIFPKLGRGVGLVLQGMWFLQMGVSIYTHWMAQGCWLKEKSRGNYTVKCKGHSEYHRARAIATLQFNCCLALVVVLVAGLYSVVARRVGIGSGRGELLRYKPLGAELQAQVESPGKFTLDSDDDDDDGDEEVREDGNVVRGKAGGEVELGVNGNGVHR